MTNIETSCAGDLVDGSFNCNEISMKTVSVGADEMSRDLIKENPERDSSKRELTTSMLCLFNDRLHSIILTCTDFAWKR